MRKNFETQQFLFEPSIPELEIAEGSRHPLYAGIRSLQWIFPKRHQICNLIKNDLCQSSSSKMGAEGMSGWQVFVFWTIRMIHEKTYDDLELYANEMPLIRQLLEINPLDKSMFSSKTLQDNLRKVTPETTEELNRIFQGWVVDAGYEDGKNVRADSFACKRPIHYPTDQSILLDAINVVLRLNRYTFGKSYGWRQADYLQKKSKQLARKVSLSKKGKASGVGKKEQEKNKKKRIKEAYQALISIAKNIQIKTFNAMEQFEGEGKTLTERSFNDLVWSLETLDQCISQAEVRVIKGKDLDSKDKLLSIFEWETEWINRGKFPVPYEFGHRVFLAEGKSGLILDYSVGKGKTDLSELSPMLERLKEKYGRMDMISLDKGFWRKNVRKELQEYVDQVIIAKKGKTNKEEKEIEREVSFVEGRKWRSGVESLISCCVRANGMGRCRDKGITAFRRWVGMGVLARNLITFGRILMKEDQEKEAA